MQEDVCSRKGCGTRGHFKRCGRCKMTRYCGPECQKQDWPAHKSGCVPNHLPAADPNFVAIVESGLPARMAASLSPGVDDALYKRGIESGAYQDTRVDLGHGVTLGVSMTTGYWIKIKGMKDPIVLGTIVGMVPLATAIDKELKKYGIKKIKGHDACVKLFEAIKRVRDKPK